MAMIKFLKGNYADLSAKAVTEGQILICKDSKEMFVDISATERIKVGDYNIVASISELPAANTVPSTRLYYVEDGNILARSNGTTWTQINKQPTTEELKQQLGLGAMAYKTAVSYDDVDAGLKAKIDASTSANHSHDNKDVLDGISAEKVAAWDASEQNANKYADGLDKAMGTRMTAAEGKITTLIGADTVDGSVAKALKDAKAYTDGQVSDAKTAVIGTDEDTAASNTVKGAKKYADSLNTAMDTRVDALEGAIGEGGSVGAQIDAKINTLDVTDTAVDGKYVSAVSEEDGKIKVLRESLPDYTDVYEAKGEAAKVQAKLDAEITRAGDAESANTAAAAAAKTAADNAQKNVDALKAKVGTVPEDKTVVEMIADAQTAATYNDTNIKKDIADNKTAIATLNGGSDVDGSVDKKVADAINDFATKVSDDQTINTFKELIDYAAAHTAEYSELSGEVQKNTTAIATLNGKDTEAGSVAKAIKDAIAAENLAQYAKDEDLTALTTRVSTAEGKITTAEADIDALEKTVEGIVSTGGQANVIETVKVNGTALTPDSKKAVDVIVPTGALANKDTVDETDLAKALADKINAKAEKSTLDTLANLVGTIPDGASASTVVAYVDEKVAGEGVSALKTRVTTAEGKITTLETQMTTVNGDGEGSIKKAADDALTSAKAYTDDLKNGQVATNKADIDELKTGKADKATTLAGYGITDAYTKDQVYTKTEIETKIQDALTWLDF